MAISFGRVDGAGSHGTGWGSRGITLASERVTLSPGTHRESTVRVWRVLCGVENMIGFRKKV